MEKFLRYFFGKNYQKIREAYDVGIDDARRIGSALHLYRTASEKIFYRIGFFRGCIPF